MIKTFIVFKYNVNDIRQNDLDNDKLYGNV